MPQNNEAAWAFIAVMGVTGAGKSTFIQNLTGDDSVEIGHSLESCTSKLEVYNLKLNGVTVQLLDTPGFNDTNKKESEVLENIADWLEDSYNKERKLNGIIYLHNIQKPRMEGSALRNLKMFRKLCGDKPLKNVILATTFWNSADHDQEVKREEELRTRPEFWGDMLQKGSSICRYTDRESGLNMVAKLLKKEPVILDIQHELVEEKMQLGETAAGQTVNEELLKLEEKHQKETAQIRLELEQAIKDRDEEMQEILRGQEERMEKEIMKIQREREQLNSERRAERRRMKNQMEIQLRDMEMKVEESEKLIRQELEKQKEEQEHREREQRNSERRAERRKMKNEFDSQLRGVEAKMEEREKRARQELERQRQEQERMLMERLSHTQDMLEMQKQVQEASFREMVAQVRINENKISADEREQLEQKILELEGRLGQDQGKKKARGTGKFLVQALRVIFPLSTLLTLGIPIPFPFFGSSEEEGTS